MKRGFLLLFAALMACTTAVGANEDKVAKNVAKGDEYRRSSLCLVMAKDSKAPMASAIENAFCGTPMPDKYNDHNVGERIFLVESLAITDRDRELFNEAKKAGAAAEAKAERESGSNGTTKKSGGGLGMLAAANESSTDNVAILAYKYLRENYFGQKMAAAWFGGTESNSPDVIFERGLYDASAQRIDEAAASIFGNDELREAGIELIPNTFAVVSRYEYLSKDELIAQISKVIFEMVGQTNNDLAILAGTAVVAGIKASLGDGYYVKTRSFLFQLDWSDEMFEFVDKSLWNNPEAWEANKERFKFKYIGNETAWARTTASVGSAKPEEELVRIATINAMDDVLAKLEKKYEIFKTKVPLIVESDGEGKRAKQILSAKIGMKEGLKGGEKFEVLEASYDEIAKQHKYKRIGVVKVSKKQVWDNRFMADVASGEPMSATRFEGGKSKYYSGCVLRQIK